MAWSEGWTLPPSQIADLPEGQESASLRVGFYVADDDVIHQFDFENLGRIPQNSRHADVSLAGGRVSSMNSTVEIARLW